MLRSRRFGRPSPPPILSSCRNSPADRSRLTRVRQRDALENLPRLVHRQLVAERAHARPQIVGGEAAAPAPIKEGKRLSQGGLSRRSTVDASVVTAVDAATRAHVERAVGALDIYLAMPVGMFAGPRGSGRMCRRCRGCHPCRPSRTLERLNVGGLTPPIRSDARHRPR